MLLLDVEPLDLGPDVRAVGLELVEADENREPVRGPDAARIWSRILRAVPAAEPWGLDFFSHLDRIRDFCERNRIAFRDASQRSLVISAPEPPALESLLDRFRAEPSAPAPGGRSSPETLPLEGDLAPHAWAPITRPTRITISALSVISKTGPSSCSARSSGPAKLSAAFARLLRASKLRSGSPLNPDPRFLMWHFGTNGLFHQSFVLVP